MSKQPPSPSERRSFLTRLHTGAASLAALAMGSAVIAQAQSKSATTFTPTRDPQDDWMELPGKHRLVFDTTANAGLGDAILYANNYIAVNASDYGLQSSDLAVILVARHFSTPFAYTDAMWAKYGASIAKMAKLVDPKTNEAPKANPRSEAMAALARQGVQIAVCAMATQALAGIIAGDAGTDAGAINTELAANLVPNARMVPAGIVAINRAQERGYSLVTP